jgi:hypothetical protein
VSSSLIALALWGLCGAFINSASRLITAVLGEQEIGRRGVQRAWAQFAVAMVFGPAAAVAFTPLLMARVGPAATESAAAFAIGLSVNWAWPVLVEVLVPALRRALRVVVADMAGKLNPGDK